MVFRRMTKTAMLDIAFPQMESTYEKLENLLHQKFYYPGKIFKILNEESDLLWKNKIFANNLADYIAPETTLSVPVYGINKPYSIGLVNKSGRLEIHSLINPFRKYLSRQNSIVFEPIEYDKIIFTNNSVKFKQFSAQKIIFCEGSAASQNPFFSKIQFKHSKGEVLEVRLPNVKSEATISDQIFLMPLDNDRFKLGATYTWDELNHLATENAHNELLFKLVNVTAEIPEIVNQKAGICPTTHDRKPVIGILPHLPQIGIFNGLGSKGALLAPYCASTLCNFLIGKSNFIPEGINVSRYFKGN